MNPSPSPPPVERRPWENAIARAFVAGTTLYLFVHCWIVSGRKPLWMDELVSFTLVTDPSLTHALTAMAHGADGGFPSYYLAAWPVAQLFGSGEWTIRMVSSAFIAAGFALLFGLLRRTCGLRPAMLAITLSIGGSTLILYQNSEVRFYADLFFSTVVAVCGFDRIFRCAEQGRPAGRAMVLNVLGHALLVLTHPFGIAYSAATSFVALVTFFWLRPKVFLLPYIASSAVGDAFFALWVRGFLQQARMLGGHGTLPVPTVPDFFRVYAQVMPMFYYDDGTKAWATGHLLPVSHHLLAVAAIGGVVLGLMATAVVIARTLAASPLASTGDGPAAPADAHLLILAATFVLVPTGIWITSHLGRSLFINRYFISSVVGFAILYAHAFARLGRWVAVRGAWTTRRGRVIGGAAVGLFAAVYVAWPLAAAIITPDGHASLRARIDREARGVPVVSAPTGAFWQESHYAPVNRSWFILDYDVAYGPDSGTFGVSEYVFSSALKDYYPSLHILPGVEFLRRNPEFIVAEGDPWYQHRLRNNPAYTDKPTQGLPPGEHWLVRRANP